MSTSNGTTLVDPELLALDTEIARLDKQISLAEEGKKEEYSKLIYVLAQYYAYCEGNVTKYRSLVAFEYLERRQQNDCKRVGMIAHDYGLVTSAAARNKKIPISIKGLIELGKTYPKPTNSVERREVVRKIESRLDRLKYLTSADIKALPGPNLKDDEETPLLGEGLRKMITSLNKFFKGKRQGKLDELLQFKQHLSVVEVDDLVEALEDVIQSAQSYKSRFEDL